MGKTYFAILICLTMAMATVANNFENYGVGVGDTITFRIEDSHTQSWVDGSSVDFNNDGVSNYIQGVTLVTGDEFEVRITAFENTPLPRIRGDYFVEGELVADTNVREARNTDWEQYESDFNELVQELQNERAYFDVDTSFIDADDQITTLVNFSFWEIVFQNNITYTFTSIITFDKTTGTYLYSYDGDYISYTNHVGEYTHSETIFEYVQTEFKEAEKEAEFKILGPGFAVVAAVSLVIILGRSRNSLH